MKSSNIFCDVRNETSESREEKTEARITRVMLQRKKIPSALACLYEAFPTAVAIDLLNSDELSSSNNYIQTASSLMTSVRNFAVHINVARRIIKNPARLAKRDIFRYLRPTSFSHEISAHAYTWLPSKKIHAGLFTSSDHTERECTIGET